MSPDSSRGMAIAGRRIGPAHPFFVIAEIGLNHGGSPGKALALVDAAARAGAAAIKLQTLFADDLVAGSCPAPAHVQSESLRDFFRQFELDEAAHHAVAARARAHGLAVMATPFSLDAVALLERVGVDAIKIASGDLTWDGLIARAAMSRLPLVISTGMSTLDEVEHALVVARRSGADDVAMLHCVSAYPVPRGSENLAAIRTLSDTLHVPVGLSDHSEDTFNVPAAIALGASLYERHLVLEHGDGSIDDAVSSTPEQLAAVVRDAARAQVALGTGEKLCLPAEAVNLTASRRGLYVARSLPAGHLLQVDDLVALRPLHGVAASRLPMVVGCRLRRPVAAGEPFDESVVEVTLGQRRPRVA